MVAFLLEKLPTIMKLLRFFFLQAICLVMFYVPICVFAIPRTNSGFYMPDDVGEVSMPYKTYKNLILLPVIINDTIEVNLILDTGCRNLVLFGKRFRDLLKMEPGKKVQFSGLGNGNPVYGSLSLKNKVSISEVIGEKIPVVVVADRNVFGRSFHIHGVIGYDIFIKFEIELNPKEKIITFRPAFSSQLAADYEHVPIRIEDSRPILDSRIGLKSNIFPCQLMIDTGSSLGLLVKTTDINKIDARMEEKELGWGFNGPITGFEANAEYLEFTGFLIVSLPASIVQSPWHNYASIGMDILKNYSMVLNYCKEYVGFKKIA
jgi:hypothetical protein